MDKDGNIDIEKLINETSVLEKIKDKFNKKAKTLDQQETAEQQVIDWSRFNTQDINFKDWSDARNAYYTFFEKNKDTFLANGKKIEDIDVYFNNVCMCSDKDYLNYIKSIYGKRESVTAFNVEGTIFMPSDTCSKDISHEVTHSWGNLYIDNTGNYNMYYNSISEALTETIACSMKVNGNTTVAYTCNVEFIERINNQLEKHGYKNAFLDAYLSSDVSRIKNIIDGIAGQGYYDQLAYRFYENQQEYVKMYSTNDSTGYNRTSDGLDIFLDALDIKK